MIPVPVARRTVGFQQTAVVNVDELFGNLAGVLGDTMRNTNRRALALSAGWLRDQQRKAWHRVRVRRASVDTWRYASEGQEEDVGALAHVFHGSWEKRGSVKGSKVGQRRLRRKREYSIRKDAAKATQVKSASVHAGSAQQGAKGATLSEGFANTGRARRTSTRRHARGARSGGRTLNASIAAWKKPTQGTNGGYVDAGVTFLRYGGGAENFAHLLEAGHTIMHPGMGRIGFASGKWPVKKTFERGTPAMIRMWTGYMMQSVKEMQRGNAQWFKHSDYTGKEGRRRLRHLTMTLGKG